MTFYDYVKENFIKSFFKLFNKQRPYLLNTKGFSTIILTIADLVLLA